MFFNLSCTHHDGEAFKTLPVYMTRIELDEIYNVFNSYGDSAKIVEWGSGGSTIAWLMNLKPSQTFVCIEHDLEWYNKVIECKKQLIQTNNDYYALLKDLNHRVYHIPKEGSSPGPDAGQWDLDGAETYINGPANEDIFNFDVYIIDGFARALCAINLFKKAKKRNATVFLHDYGANTHRYQDVVDVYPKHFIYDPPVSLSFDKMLKLNFV
jgi:hypothetical protein